MRTTSTRARNPRLMSREVISRAAYRDTCSSGRASTVRRGRMTDARSLSSNPITETFALDEADLQLSSLDQLPLDELLERASGAGS